MRQIECVYGMLFSEMVKKFRETLNFEGLNLGDLINMLDGKYSGFKDELLDTSTGRLVSWNQILLSRDSEATRPFFSLDDEILDGDILTFY